MIDEDWYALCRKCLQKKYKNISELKDDIKLKNKATNYLIYNGFSYDEINHAIYNTNPNAN
jgi:regulatory protein